ncbi:protein C3orf33-like [Styela clava]
MDVVNKASEFFDKHIRIVKNAGYVIAGIGVFMIVRRSRLFTKFNAASDIPKDFIQKRIKLRGIVQNVCTNNTLHIEHIPSMSYPAATIVRRFQKQLDNNGLISLDMAGVSMNDVGIDLVRGEIEGKAVWFELLNHVEKDQNAPAVIYRRKYAILRNYNIYVVKMGYGAVDNVPNCYHLKVQQSLQRSLLKAQKKAAIKKRGIWKD